MLSYSFFPYKAPVILTFGTPHVILCEIVGSRAELHIALSDLQVTAHAALGWLVVALVTIQMTAILIRPSVVSHPVLKFFAHVAALATIH